MYVLEPTVGVAVDCRCASAMSDHIRNGDVTDLAGWRLILALGSIDLAAALDVEMNRVAITPPEPVEAARLDRNVRNNHVLHHTAIEHHERQTAIRIVDHHVIDGDAADRIRIPIAKLQCARSRTK